MRLEDIAEQQKRNRQRAEAQTKALKELASFEESFIKKTMPEIQGRISEWLTKRGVASSWQAPVYEYGYNCDLQFPHVGGALSLTVYKYEAAVDENLQSYVQVGGAGGLIFPLLTLFVYVNYDGAAFSFIWRGSDDTDHIVARLMEILNGDRPESDFALSKSRDWCFIASAVYGLRAI